MKEKRKCVSHGRRVKKQCYVIAISASMSYGMAFTMYTMSALARERHVLVRGAAIDSCFMPINGTAFVRGHCHLVGGPASTLTR